MWKRSYWVLVTYAKRRLTWLFVAAALISVVVLNNMIDGKIRSVNRDVFSGDPIRTFKQLEATLASDRAHPVELDYGQLFGFAVDKVFPPPRNGTLHIGPEEEALIHAALEPVEGLKNVVAMKTGFAIDQAMINRIAKFKTLKRLSMDSDLGYESLDLRPLSSLVELEELQLGLVDRVDSLEPLEKLPSLRTLGIGRAMMLHKHGFGEIAKIPQLRELSIPDLRNYPGLQETVGMLKQSKTLRRINYGVSWDDDDVLAEVQSQVAEVCVAPSMIRGARHVVLFFALLAAAAVGFPTAQLAGQLSLPPSYLAPLYRAPHYLVACLIIAMLILGAIGGLIYVGAKLVAASSLVLCAGGLNFWSATRIPSKGYVDTKTGFINLLIALPIGAALPFVVALGAFRPMWIDNYLMSGQFVVPILCLVFAGWLGWLGFHNLESRLRIRTELGLPVVLTFRDLQVQSIDWAHIPSSNVPINVQLPLRMNLPFVAKAVLVVTLISIPMRAIVYDDLGRMALMSCLGAAVVCIYLTGVKWWQEIPYFASTMIRPPDRKGHVHQLMQGVRSDIYSFTPLWLACVIAIGLTGTWQLEGLGLRLLHGLVAVASVTLGVYAAILWVLTVRSAIGISVVFLITYLPCSMMMMEIAVIDQRVTPLLSAVTIVLTGCATSVIAFIAIILVRRYLARVEWAKFR